MIKWTERSIEFSSSWLSIWEWKLSVVTWFDKLFLQTYLYASGQMYLWLIKNDSNSCGTDAVETFTVVVSVDLVCNGYSIIHLLTHVPNMDLCNQFCLSCWCCMVETVTLNITCTCRLFFQILSYLICFTLNYRHDWPVSVYVTFSGLDLGQGS